MKRIAYLGLAAALVAAAFLSSASIRAEDGAGAPAMPPPQPKIDHPFLKALVGDWTVKTSGEGPQGPVSASGRSRIALGVRDTVLLQEYESDMTGGFAGHGVAKVSDDGKTMKMWWFDLFGAEPVLLSGPLTDTSARLSGECPGGKVDIVWTKVEGGFDFQMSLNGKPGITDQYRKSSG